MKSDTLVITVSRTKKIKLDISAPATCVCNEEGIIVHNLYIGPNLYLTKEPYSWKLCDQHLQHKESGSFVAVDPAYNLYITQNEKDAAPFSFSLENGAIQYRKSELRCQIEANRIPLYPLLHSLTRKCRGGKQDVGILLCAGKSSRFGSATPKQLTTIEGVPVFLYSVRALLPHVGKLLIVTNSDCYKSVKSAVRRYPSVSIVVNDVNCRLKSIAVGVRWIKENIQGVRNVIIQDAARPFVPSDYYAQLGQQELYAQFYMRLVNGLVQKKQHHYDFVDRDTFLEICTPLSIRFSLLYWIIVYFIDVPMRLTYEFIPVLNEFNIGYKLVEGHHKYLRKITYDTDL